MLKQNFEYTDFNNHKRDVDLYFNLTDIEVMDFSDREARGMQKRMQEMVDTQDIRSILKFIRELIAASYGIKSEDGIRHEKSPEITAAFVQSAYYSDFLFSLFENDGEKGIKFIEGVLPASLIKKAQDRIDFERNLPPARDEDAPTPYAPGAREQFAEAQKEAVRGLSESPAVRTPEEDPAYQAWLAERNAQ